MKVFVTGCFDILHAGHVAFLQGAASYGELYVCIGSDETITNIKSRSPFMNQDERQFILESLDCVHKVLIGSGSGPLDFIPEFYEIGPDIFIVNDDGDSQEKREFCEDCGVEYIVLDRVPAKNLPVQSSTNLKHRMNYGTPYRLMLAGGWIDQPYVSSYASGSMVVMSIHPHNTFSCRSGMATSSRKTIEQIWGYLPLDSDYEKVAKLIFGAENPPGTEYVSGSQDMIGIVYPGINRLDYDGLYWPHHIENTRDTETARWLEDHLYLIQLPERPKGYNPLKDMNPNFHYVKILGESGILCYDAILKQDLDQLGVSFEMNNDAWCDMFPATMPSDITDVINQYNSIKGVYGCMLTGAGGGGYLTVASSVPIDNAIRIEIRV